MFIIYRINMECAHCLILKYIKNGKYKGIKVKDILNVIRYLMMLCFYVLKINNKLLVIKWFLLLHLTDRHKHKNVFNFSKKKMYIHIKI